MGRKKKNSKNASEPRGETVLVVCRGGDCGSRIKHPELDHREQLRTVRETAPDQVAVLTSRCLEACDHSNVFVVIPAAHALSQGQKPTWIGEVNDEETTKDVLAWISSEPTEGNRPVLVEIKEFQPTKRNRHELDEETSR